MSPGNDAFGKALLFSINKALLKRLRLSFIAIQIKVDRMIWSICLQKAVTDHTVVVSFKTAQIINYIANKIPKTWEDFMFTNYWQTTVQRFRLPFFFFLL